MMTSRCAAVLTLLACLAMASCEVQYTPPGPDPNKDPNPIGVPPEAAQHDPGSSTDADGGTSVDAAAPRTDSSPASADAGAPSADAAGARSADAAGAPSADAAGGDTASPVPIECAPPASPNGSGEHNAGRDCMSCHSQLDAEIRWTIAGTLFDAVSGGRGVGGATIEITDANGQQLKLVTGANGNFYTTHRVAFPLKVNASACPDAAAMQSDMPQGSCNTGGCHDSNFRIHLP